jgi:UDP:flavonoid glycosyltransferase YjiC (YdhE family)
VCSVFGDQPWWGARVEALGTGVTFPYTKLDEKRLAAAVTRVLEAPVRARARALADAVRDENGLAAAVSALERVLPTTPFPE